MGKIGQRRKIKGKNNSQQTHNNAYKSENNEHKKTTKTTATKAKQKQQKETNIQITVHRNTISTVSQAEDSKKMQHSPRATGPSSTM